MIRALKMAAAACAALLAAHGTAATASPRFSSLYVFGDSLVDAGNIAVLTGGATPNQAAGYFPGRFTNGYNYVDYINYQLFGTATTASLRGGNNFAFGGARIVSDTTDPIPDLTPQLGAYAARQGAAAGDASALYILNMGGNDIFALGRFAAGNPNALNPIGDAEAYIEALVSIYANAVTTLDQLGARNILITGIPNSTDPLALKVDQLLQARLDGLVLASDTNLMRYSYIDFFGRVATDPGSLGLPSLRTDTTCIQARAQATGCAGIFSFDGVHPTAAVQSALFRDMVTQFNLAPVPEPASWAMMIAGFGVVGTAIRRRRTGMAAVKASAFARAHA